MLPEFNLFHLTDSHWVIGKLSGNDQYLESVPGLLRLFKDEVLSSSRGTAGTDQSLNILALGGDNVTGGFFFSAKPDKTAPSRSTEPTYKQVFEAAGDIVEPVFTEDSPFVVFLNELILPILEAKRGDRPLFDAIIAVPGNHDVDRFAPENKKFWKFERAFNELQKRLAQKGLDIPVITPFSASPLQVLTVGSGNFKRTITVWAANTSSKCGEVVSSGRDVAALLKKSKQIIEAKVETETNEEAKRSQKDHLDSLTASIAQAEQIDDPGFIEPESLREIEALLRDTPPDALRIAIAHHNVLPLRNDDYKKGHFWNAGLFTRFLLDNRFRILCHGHQHVAAVSAYTRTLPERDGFHSFQSYLTNTLLHVGGPAFDVMKGPNVSHRGFNIIRGRFSPDHYICGIKVIQHTIDAEERFSEAAEEYDIALKLADAKPEKPEREKQRKDAIQDANRLIYSSRSLAGLVRAFDDEQKYDQNHASSLRAFFRRLGEIRAVYALSVFSPTDWLHRKLMGVFMGFGRVGLTLAAQKGALRFPGVAGVSLFRFSTPLAHGIKNAANVAKTLRISHYADLALVRHGNSAVKLVQAEYFLHDIKDAIAAGNTSASYWGKAVFTASGSPLSDIDISQTKLVIEDICSRPHHNFSPGRDNHYDENSELFEFPRIVLWTREQLQKPSALDIIQYHEQMGFPLFWLDREAMKTVTGKTRNSVGYLSIIGMQPKAVGYQFAEEKCHLPDGTPVEDARLAQEAWQDEAPAKWISDPTILRTNIRELTGRFRPMHEFIFLMGRKDLVFAADAWTAAQGGDECWNSFTSRLTAARNEL